MKQVEHTKPVLRLPEIDTDSVSNFLINFVENTSIKQILNVFQSKSTF